MAEIKQFNSFPVSFNRLKGFTNQKVLAEYYHHDVPSEPSVSVLNVAEYVSFLDFETENFIGIRFADGTNVDFSSQIYNTNLSNDSVVFSSKNDEETYCIITLI
ncbi:hypothetical protein ACW0TQ_07955 [Oceanobacillus sp. M60]|uniref:hypothetical protein n=1 Tax=Oceanobacillus TaxID=182709 RepID=UPI0030DA5A26